MTMRPNTETVVFACLLSTVLGSGAAAHTRLRAVVATDPTPPVAVRPCVVRVSFLTPEGALATLIGWDARLIAEMRAHPMPPVDATLRPDRTARAWEATVVFPMPGAWEMAISAAKGHDRVTGTVRLFVVAEPNRPETPAGAAAPGDAGPATETSTGPAAAPLSATMDAPGEALPWSPWAVVGSALGLTVAAETIALLGAWRRSRRPRA